MTDNSPRAPRGAGAALVALCVVAMAALLLWHDPRFFFHDDYQEAGLPDFFAFAHGFLHGQWPLLTGHSWIAGAPGASYQSGLFSLFYAAMAVLAAASGLPLPLSAALFSVSHLVVLALGVYALARGRGHARPLAALAAIATTYSGYLIVWGAGDWIPILTSFAWLPWFWWAAERAVDSRRPGHAVLAGFFLYLTITGGWPWTDLMAALVSATIAARLLYQTRRVRPLLPLVAGWAIGLGLSAPALLLFVDFMHHTVRSSMPALTPHWQWLVPPEALLASLVPNLVTQWNQFGASQPHLSLELAEGLVPVCAVIAALLGPGRRAFARRNGWELALCVLGVALSVLPGFGNFRWSFRWLPLAQLPLALLAADALGTREDAIWFERPTTWALAAALANLAVAYSQPVLPLAFAWGYLGVAALWWVLDQDRRPAALRRWAPLGATVAALLVTYWFVPVALSVPTWNFSEALRDPAPLNPNALYFRVSLNRDYFGPQAFTPDYNRILRIGDSFNYAHLHFVNGYNTTELADMWQMFPQPSPHGFFKPDVAHGILRQETGPNRLLTRMGVDDLIVSASLLDDVPRVVAQGWKVVAHGPDGVVLHRLGDPSPTLYGTSHAVVLPTNADAIRFFSHFPKGPLPIVLDALPGDRPGPRNYGPLTITALTHSDLTQRYQVAVGAKAPALALFAQPWYPGMRAWLDGRELPVHRFEVLMMAVELPAGAHGTLTLAYRPRSLERGLALAAATLLATLLGWWWAARKRAAAQRAPAPESPAAAAR